MGESRGADLQVRFDRRVHLHFQGAQVSSMPNSNQTPGWQIIAGTDRGGSTDKVRYTICNSALPDMRDERWENS